MDANSIRLVGALVGATVATTALGAANGYLQGKQDFTDRAAGRPASLAHHVVMGSTVLSALAGVSLTFNGGPARLMGLPLMVFAIANFAGMTLGSEHARAAAAQVAAS